MKYKVVPTKEYKKCYAKLSAVQKDAVDKVVKMLASGITLSQKYCDHKLKGKFLGCRDCHVKSDLVLVYAKNNKALVLVLMYIGSHSELF